MVQLLAGDIGGTKTILRWVETSVKPKLQGKFLTQTLLYEKEYPSQSYGDLVPMVEEFWAEAQAQTTKTREIQAACFAIAGPVVENTSHLTNLNWQLEGDRLAKSLEIPLVQLINDFAAVGYGIPGLGPEDLKTLQTGEVDRRAPIAVLGAGTGLGQCFLIPDADQSHARVFATEGGHGDFAPRTALEFRLLEYLQRQRSLTHISVERIVSGQGILAFYQFLRDEENLAEDPAVAAVVRAWETAADYSADLADPGAAIAQTADSNELCDRAMNHFMEAYGAEAGNLALKLLSFGGVYIAGGIAAKNTERLASGSFLQAFWDKGRMEPLMQRMPVHVILNRQVGLIGAALYAGSLVG